MICPNCSRQIKTPLAHKQLFDSESHIWGICPECKEVIHFFYNQQNEFLYGWVQSKEANYEPLFKNISSKKSILYIPDSVENDRFIKICRDFASFQGWNVGFIVSPLYREKSSILNAVHPVVILEEKLFPTFPSFLAERIICKNLHGKIYSYSKTYHERIELLK